MGLIIHSYYTIYLEFKIYFDKIYFIDMLYLICQ